jgi:pimeloyl-ACP methyl ester carboxylesterase
VSTEATASIERFAEICGRRLRIRVRGEGRPVLLINGLGTNVAMWTPLLEQLSGFQLICFDAPGTGLSKAPVLPYRIAHIADVARRVLDEVGVERADVLGYSLGGAVAQQLAYQEPERVRRMILVSSSCGVGQIPGPLRAAFAVMTPARHYAMAASRAAMWLVGLAPAEKDSRNINELVAGWRQEGGPVGARLYPSDDGILDLQQSPLAASRQTADPGDDRDRRQLDAYGELGGLGGLPGQRPAADCRTLGSLPPA